MDMFVLLFLLACIPDQAYFRGSEAGMVKFPADDFENVMGNMHASFS